jgi:hypothetical protein
MLPPHERLKAVDPSGAEIDERLEVQEKLTTVDRTAKAARECQS